MEPTTTALVPTQMEHSNRSLFFDIQQFADGQRMATLLSQSKLIPESFRGNLPDCVIILELAQRLGASPLAIMQNTYVVHGKPGFSAQFVIAMINSCGRYSPLRFKVEGDGDEKTCVAWAYELRTGEILEGPPVSIGVAKKEGWYGKNGSKWQTMPELMLRYRAATFFGRMYAPELMMGMRTVEELREQPEEVAAPASDIVERLNAPQQEDQVVKESSTTPIPATEPPAQEKQSNPVPADQPPANEAAISKEIAAIDRLTSPIAVDRWRMSNYERIAKMGAVAAEKIMSHAQFVYEALSIDEREADDKLTMEV